MWEDLVEQNLNKETTAGGKQKRLIFSKKCEDQIILRGTPVLRIRAVVQLIQLHEKLIDRRVRDQRNARAGMILEASRWAPSKHHAVQDPCKLAAITVVLVQPGPDVLLLCHLKVISVHRLRYDTESKATKTMVGCGGTGRGKNKYWLRSWPFGSIRKSDLSEIWISLPCLHSNLPSSWNPPCCYSGTRANTKSHNFRKHCDDSDWNSWSNFKRFLFDSTRHWTKSKPVGWTKWIVWFNLFNDFVPSTWIRPSKLRPGIGSWAQGPCMDRVECDLNWKGSVSQCLFTIMFLGNGLRFLDS